MSPSDIVELNLTMTRKLKVAAAALTYILSAMALPTQGGQGRNMREMDGSVQAIEQGIGVYLNGDEIKTILSPGEYCEWNLNLKAGQVVVAEARSDAFDPALEILDHDKKVVTKNDDRYPGDQRPLLFWRCEQDGAYALHLRCFHDKSGGQAFVRFRTYDTVDLLSDQKVERELPQSKMFLIRIPFKAGQIKEVYSAQGGPSDFMSISGNVVISQTGLPDLNLALPIQQSAGRTVIMAPVDGDYYLTATPYGNGAQTGKIQVWTREIVAEKLTGPVEALEGKATTGDVGLWQIRVRSGDFLDATTPELNLNCGFTIVEAPDISKYDVSNPDKNPFFPQLKKQGTTEAVIRRDSRDRDNRRNVFYVRRDATLWLISNGAGSSDRQYTLHVKPAAPMLREDTSNRGKLQISNTDFWSFDAKSGDVIAIETKSDSFNQVSIAYDPDMREVRHFEAEVDQREDSWQMIAQKPGRYRIALACRGNGGGGDYTMTRKTIHAKDFGLGNPARAEISHGEVQIWKFTVKPNDPVLLHWNSSSWSYDVSVYDENGQRTEFQRDDLDEHNKFGIVSRPATYVIVLTGGAKASYSIELGAVPGFKGN